MEASKSRLCAREPSSAKNVTKGAQDNAQEESRLLRNMNEGAKKENRTHLHFTVSISTLFSHRKKRAANQKRMNKPCI